MRCDIVSSFHIVILDQHALSRNGLRVLVEKSKIPIGQVYDFADVAELILHLEKACTRIMLLSDQLEGQQTAVDLVRRLHRDYPSLGIIVVGSRLNTEYIGELLTGGALAYVYHKSKLEETILAAIKSVLAGETFLSSEAAALPYHQRRINQLSERDLEILNLLSEGQSVNDIAHLIGVSRRVVYDTRTRIKKYLDVTNNEQIISAALAEGLLSE